MTDMTLQIVEIDMRGQVCPSTLLVTLDSINRNQKELRSGKVKLLVRTDNRDSTATIPGTVENMGYAIEVTPKEGFYEILISRSE